MVVGILEPKIKINKVPTGYWRSLNLIPCHQNKRENKRPNIWVLRHPDVAANTIFSSEQVAIIDCIWSRYKFRVAVIHGSNSYALRRQLWIDLLSYSDEATVFIGDFNAVKGAHERSSDCMPNATSCRDFCDFIAASSFIEPPAVGLKFTWSGRRFMPSHVESTLDRALISTDFADYWSSVYTQILPRLTSDHSPIVLRCCNALQMGQRFFKFLHMWTFHENFQETVRISWMEEVSCRCPIYRVMFKLKRLRGVLKSWNRTDFGNVDTMVADSQTKLLEIQSQIANSGYTEELFDAEVTLQANINKALTRKNSLLQQKSRISWLNDGDRNTAFFHTMLRYKKKPHMISHLSIDDEVVYEQETIENHIINYFTKLFEEDSQEELDITNIEAIIDEVVDEHHNAMLTRTPDEDEIKAAVFGMDASSSPGPDGFSGKFFQTCWDIIKFDIWLAVETFFEKSYLPVGCNSSVMVLLPKKEVVHSVADLRPIVLSNFFFKIISKILANRLSIVASRYISDNQFGFISGRSIHDCIMIGSEGVNCMKRFGKGINMACKIDIKKAFDTLRWDFLLACLKVGGYDDKFINWIRIILHSARLSILYNSRLHGYFACSRGVRQGDPLSPILFGIAEDVLSALFKNCVASGHFTPMTMCRARPFPTHLFYADDILVFCKASEQNAQTIKNILTYYGSISGQLYSSEKSHLYFAEKVPTALKRSIGRIIDFSVGSLPFNYLGVPLFVGRTRASYLRPIHDRISNKFARWRGRHLSMAGRVCLVKSVIQSSLTHSMMIYHWPRSLLKVLDAKCRNFIWTGNTEKRASCLVAWERVCAIKEEGGLGVRSFTLMNKSFLMKRAWSIICGDKFGLDIMKQRYFKNFGQVKTVTAPSSVWLGLRAEVEPLVHDSYCYVGTGEFINFWKDDWVGYSIAQKCGVPHYVQDFLNYPISDYFYEGVWHFTSDFVDAFPEVVCDILLLPIGEGQDVRLWKPSLRGEVTAALAFAHHCSRFPSVRWGTWIWENYIPTRRSMICWRLIHGRLPTFDNLIRHGFIMPNYCPLCLDDLETMDHIFWSCSKIRPIWQEFLNWFHHGYDTNNSDIMSMLVAAWGYKFSSQIANYWKAGLITIIWAIWMQRNCCIFEDGKSEAKRILHTVKVAFREMEQNFRLGSMKNTCEDLLILRKIGIKGRASPPPDFINVYWWPPPHQWIKVNTDGSALGAPGRIAAGGVFRDSRSLVRGCFHVKGGLGFAFEAELLAVITAIQIAHQRTWFSLWVESDSTYIVGLLTSRSLNVPWRFLASWRRILTLLENFTLHITHIYREGNRAADIMTSNTMEEGWWPTDIEEIKDATSVERREVFFGVSLRPFFSFRVRSKLGLGRSDLIGSSAIMIFLYRPRGVGDSEFLSLKRYALFQDISLKVSMAWFLVCSICSLFGWRREDVCRWAVASWWDVCYMTLGSGSCSCWHIIKHFICMLWQITAARRGRFFGVSPRPFFSFRVRSKLGLGRSDLVGSSAIFIFHYRPRDFGDSEFWSSKRYDLFFGLLNCHVGWIDMQLRRMVGRWQFIYCCFFNMSFFNKMRMQVDGHFIKHMICIPLKFFVVFYWKSNGVSRRSALSFWDRSQLGIARTELVEGSAITLLRYRPRVVMNSDLWLLTSYALFSSLVVFLSFSSCSSFLRIILRVVQFFAWVQFWFCSFRLRKSRVYLRAMVRPELWKYSPFSEVRFHGPFF
ncbi:uncharacterized protein LOC130998178 [Salvia miltiorrhiza]|uniref:uncharacterized protein LOC130998178 n=1 Tax=Salvia miltiorrhiza TaxID=226208 RepID=UPI0025AC0901|nr:uncharacterized protein LOC130998178 [Salvia miltiorrhiza]